MTSLTKPIAQNNIAPSGGATADGPAVAAPSLSSHTPGSETVQRERWGSLGGSVRRAKVDAELQGENVGNGIISTGHLALIQPLYPWRIRFYPRLFADEFDAGQGNVMRRRPREITKRDVRPVNATTPERRRQRDETRRQRERVRMFLTALRHVASRARSLSDPLLPKCAML
eukprot:1195042-Prorocentrum_minimum.AAC.7